MRRTTSVFALCAAMVFALPAHGTQFLYTVTGTVVGEELSYDEFGVFDPDQGDAFTAQFLVDDAAALALYNYGPIGSYANGGGMIQVGTRTPLFGKLTIEGGTYAVRTGDYRLDPVIDPVTGDPSGPTAGISEGGFISRNSATGSLNLFSRYGESYSCCFPHPGENYGQSESLEFTLLSSGFTSPDYRQLGTFALLPGSGGGFYRYVYDGSYPGNMAQIALSATTLTVAAVPELRSWAMLLVGIGAAGAVLRRRTSIGSSKVVVA
jgi:hypothetical protein